MAMGRMERIYWQNVSLDLNLPELADLSINPHRLRACKEKQQPGPLTNSC
jgi:hypothetical protein